MTNVPYMLLGAALVALGVLASALADRVRGIRLTRDDGTAPREARARPISVPTRVETIHVIEPTAMLRTVTMKPDRPRAATKDKEPAKGHDGADDVIAALVGAGYKKPIAADAAWACSAAERATIEGWTVAALRRCAQGAVS